MFAMYPAQQGPRVFDSSSECDPSSNGLWPSEAAARLGVPMARREAKAAIGRGKEASASGAAPSLPVPRAFTGTPTQRFFAAPDSDSDECGDDEDKFPFSILNVYSSPSASSGARGSGPRALATPAPDSPPRVAGGQGEPISSRDSSSVRGAVATVPGVSDVSTPDKTPRAAGALTAQRHGHQSRYHGVRLDLASGQWACSVRVGAGTRFLGNYHSEEAAARAYDDHVTTALGDAADLNFPPGFSHHDVDTPRDPGRRPVRSAAPRRAGAGAGAGSRARHPGGAAIRKRAPKEKRGGQRVKRDPPSASNQTSDGPKYRGVTQRNKRGKHIAQIHTSKTNIFLGSFADPEDAARCFDVAAHIAGKSAMLNFPGEPLRYELVPKDRLATLQATVAGRGPADRVVSTTKRRRDSGAEQRSASAKVLKTSQRAGGEPMTELKGATSPSSSAQRTDNGAGGPGAFGGASRAVARHAGATVTYTGDPALAVGGGPQSTTTTQPKIVLRFKVAPRPSA